MQIGNADSKLISDLEKGIIEIDQLPRLLSGLDLHGQVSQHFVRKWADKEWCDSNGPQSHSYLTWIIASLVAFTSSDTSFLSNPTGRMLMDGVSLRLGHLDGQVIKMGIVIGQKLSGTNLGVDLSEDAFCLKIYNQLYNWIPPKKTEKPKELIDDSDEIIPPPVAPPHFLADLIEYIISDDDWRKHQAVIDTLPIIVQKSTSLELQDYGERFLRNLIFWQDRYKLENFDDKLGDFLAITMLKSPILGGLIGNFVNGNDINDGRKVQLLNSTVRAISIEAKSDLCLNILGSLLVPPKDINNLILEKVLITAGVLIFNCKQSFNSEKMLCLYFDYLTVYLPKISLVYGLKRALLLGCALIIQVPKCNLFIQKWSIITDLLGDIIASTDKHGRHLGEEIRPLAIDLSQQILTRLLPSN
jgi:hypothetical protein